MRRESAYLTVYLALCLTLILSLYLVLIDGARRGGAAMEAVCAAEMGMQNIMAEYHRELLNQFGLFAVDSSYGTDVCSKKNTEAHLMGYLKKNIGADNSLLMNTLYRDFFGLQIDDAELTGVSILTDEGGAVFRRMAVEAAKSDVGLNIVDEVKEWMTTVEVNGLDEADYEGKRQELDAELEGYDGSEVKISETESVQLELQNPAAQVNAGRGLGVLHLVTDGQNLSVKGINSAILIGQRMGQGNINKGNMAVQPADSLGERILFQEYLLRNLGCYGNVQTDEVLDYQIEYLIAGKDYDTDNLKGVAERLIALREAANVAYLFSDQAKMMEIRAAALLACGVVPLPFLIPVMEGIILFGWAYAESVYDVKSLLSGGKIPLLKDKISWHYSLERALLGNFNEASGDGNGLAYQDYLRILMTCTSLDTLTARAMDIVEANIRQTPGNAVFRLDGCYAQIEANIEISSSYGYQFQLRRTRAYW